MPVKTEHPDELLRVQHLKRKFNGFELFVEELCLEEGRMYSLTGPNGSGKTTLLYALNLLEKPDSGEIFFRGTPCLRKRSRQVSVRRNMAMVLENPYLFRKSVLSNVMYGLRVRGVNRIESARRARAALEKVHMERFAQRKAQELSRGETQRVAIARAIVLEPEILFFDEPFTNIDRSHVVLVEQLIKQLNREDKTTILLTTHDLFQAYRMSEEVFSLVQGKLVKGSIENLFSGKVVEVDDATFVRIHPGMDLQVSTERREQVHLIIPPEDIILSKQRLESSARNSLQGRIKSIEVEGSTVRIVCNAGVEFVSLITRDSFNRMKLTVGSEICMTFKTTSVKVF